jgi:alpha-tubulin suppressor-like RCC1 family protein
LAIDTNFEVWGWGLNNYGQLGNGTTIDSSSPVKISHYGFATSDKAPISSSTSNDGMPIWEVVVITVSAALGAALLAGGSVYYYFNKKNNEIIKLLASKRK